MKILFLTSFYSGLKKSVETGFWKPTGMPAIYKLIERLEEKNIPFDFCFIDKTAKDTKEYNIDYFKSSKFYVVGCKKKIKLPKILNFFFLKIIYLKKIYKFLKQIQAKKYDLVYIDRSNVSAFIIVHYFFKIKGILRLHGIGLQYVKFKKRRSYFIKNILNYYSYKLPFKTIIASRDGTPVHEFSLKFTNKKSNKIVLLNGVDSTEFSNEKETDNKNTINFLFVGRLEKDKGIIEIIKSFQNHNLKNDISLTIIGDGNLKEFVKEQTLNQNHINYLGPLPHSEVKHFYMNSDVFISFNYLGNISNVVLEAIKFNLLIITFEKDIKNEKDIDSNNFLGENVMYVNRNNAVSQLKNRITLLFENQNILQEYKLKIEMNLLPKIPSWKKRIDREIEIIIN